MKAQITQEVKDGVATVQRNLQQLADHSATRAGIEQMTQEHLQLKTSLQLAEANITQQLQQLNKTTGEWLL